jgi:triosephosphate isomerase
MRQLIAGNWKMNGLSADAGFLCGALAETAPLPCDLLVCPPFTHIAQVAARLRGTAIAWGGQDCHAAPSGAHTGDISAPMLADLGCTAVIVGHSERRQNHHETDAQVRQKAIAAAASGLMPIICVGETGAQRDAGQEIAVVSHQIAESLPDGFAGVIAYEPIWAIGTGRTPGIAEIASAHAHIRAALVERLGPGGAGIRILYGGSVKPDNAASLLAVKEVGGALVGGASLSAESFLEIGKKAVLF